jgi:hypothetical protein
MASSRPGAFAKSGPNRDRCVRGSLKEVAAPDLGAAVIRLHSSVQGSSPMKIFALMPKVEEAKLNRAWRTNEKTIRTRKRLLDRIQ